MMPDETPPRFVRVVPVLWIVLSLAWAVIIIVSDRPAWALALWVATTLGPLTMLDDHARS
jgi:hypothetical protein